MKKIVNILAIIFIVGIFYFGYQLVLEFSLFNELIILNGDKTLLMEFKSLSIPALLPIVFAVMAIIILIIKTSFKVKNTNKESIKKVSYSEKEIKDDNDDLYKEEFEALKKQLDLTKEIIQNYTNNNAEEIIKKTASIFNAAKGVIYEPNSTFDQLNAVASFAHVFETDNDKVSGVTEGLIGQAIKNKNILIIENVPENYLNVLSGLGSANPGSVLIIPFYKKKKVEFVIELALFKAVDDNIKKGAIYLFNFQSI